MVVVIVLFLFSSSSPPSSAVADLLLILYKIYKFTSKIRIEVPKKEGSGNELTAASQFSGYLPTAQKMIDSFKIDAAAGGAAYPNGSSKRRVIRNIIATTTNTEPQQ